MNTRMRELGIWAMSALLSVAIGGPLIFFALSLLWQARDGTHDFILVFLLLGALPVLAISHALPYVLVKDRSHPAFLKVIIPAFSGAVLAAIAMHLIARLLNYH